MHEGKAASEKITFLESEVTRLNNIIRQMKRDIFGSKSEKVIDVPGQLLFNEIEKEASQLAPVEKETITYEREKGRGKKKPYPDHLPREEKIIDLSPEEKFCPHDGTALKKIGEERKEKLKTIPAQMSIVVEKIIKYACPCCDEYVTQPRTSSILPGTIVTPELLSFIIFSKFFQALPLYRLEELFRLNGIELRRGTMARWLIQVKEQLIPIYNLLQDMAFENGYMVIDATYVQVLKENGRKAQAKSFMWARGSPEMGIVLFDYDISGGGKVAKGLMTGFSGALQADAHKGYEALDKKEILLLGCMMHARRRFHNAWIVGGKKPGLASQALLSFKFLYEKEASYKEQGLTPERRKYFRDQEIKPSLEAILEWAKSNLSKVPKASELGNALHYFVNEYDELSAFLADGRFEIDNGWLERTIRKFAIGRNNWLFCDTVEGAHASSILYSLVITAKLNGKDSFKVMTEIFTQLPFAKTAEDYEGLTALLLSPKNLNSCRKKEGALIQ
jgi:transposase